MQLRKVRPSLLRFVLEMERRLGENDYKFRWRDSDPRWLLLRLIEEAGELAHALDGVRPVSLIITEAADVANFAMMIADYFQADIDSFVDGLDSVEKERGHESPA